MCVMKSVKNNQIKSQEDFGKKIGKGNRVNKKLFYRVTSEKKKNNDIKIKNEGNAKKWNDGQLEVAFPGSTEYKI